MTRPDSVPRMSHREMSVDLELRWSDFDMLGHLNQAVYHQLLEEARARLTVGAGPDFPWVLARVELDYLAEIRPEHGPITVRTEVGEIGRSKFTLRHEMSRATGELAARGTSVIVAWDEEARRSRPLTPEQRRAFGADEQP